MITRNCDKCNKTINYACIADMKRRSKTGMCRECYVKNFPKGVKSYHWKGGEYITDRGYKLIRMPEHPWAKGNGYVFEHRLVVEKSIGRYLKPDEVIHHLNHNKRDNRIENLVITNNVEHHKKLHKPYKGSCSICGEPQLARNYCKKHYWTEYLKLHRSGVL